MASALRVGNVVTLRITGRRRATSASVSAALPATPKATRSP